MFLLLYAESIIIAKRRPLQSRNGRLRKICHNTARFAVKYCDMQSTVYKSAAQVTVFSVIEKMISFLYRIVLSRAIGAEGVGIYQICLSVFAVFLTAASSGVPVTVSRLMAKQNALGREREKSAAVTAGVVCTLFITVPAAIILFAARGALGFLFSDDRCVDLFIILLPGLILTAVYAVMRGSFWGNKQFLPYSLIELAEDSVMVILGCILVYGADSPPDGAKRAIYAVLISYIFSFIVSVTHYLRRGGKFVNPKSQLKPLLASSLPITAMRTSTSLINSAVAVILPMLLVSFCGYTSAESVALYGVALGMAMPILFAPGTLIGSIAVVVAPELSENYYRGKTAEVKSDVEKCVKSAVLIAVALIPLLYTLGKDLGVLLYSDELSGEIIARFSLMMLPMSVSMISTTILNSLHGEVKTLISFFAGSACMAACLFALTPLFGIYGYLAGVALDFTVTAIINLILLYKKCGALDCGKYILKGAVVCLSAALFGTFCNGLTVRLSSVARLFVCGAPVAAFTGAAMLGTGFFDFAALLKPVKKMMKRKRRKNYPPSSI